jgi:hypothetical protein
MPNKAADSEFENTAQQLTTKVEQHQKVSDELNSMPFQERLQMANRMASINEDHRSTDASLPKISLTVERDSGGQDHLTDMQAVTSRKMWFDKKEDVYDMPKKVEHNMFDYIADTRLARDILDSQRMTEKSEY